MARTLKRGEKRLIPKKDIQWLDHDARRVRRARLAELRTMIELMDPDEGGGIHKLTPEHTHFLSTATASDNADTWDNFLWDEYERQEGSYLKILAQMGQHDLTAYHEYMNPDEPPAHHHIWLCERLMAVERGELGLLVVSMPPGSAKSTYGSRSFIQWYMGRHPNAKVLAVGHSQRFIEDEFSKRNRDIVDTPQFREVFPDIYLSDNDRGATTWKLANFEGQYTSRGAEAGVAGVRANLIDIDDPIKAAKDGKSPTVLDNVSRWITADLFPRRLPKAPIVLIMTRWNSGDPAGRLQALHEEDNEALPGPVEFINIPAEAQEDDPLGRAPGEWLWEEFYGKQHYLTLRATMSATDWSALYMGQPLDMLGEYVKEDDFGRYDQYPVHEPKEGQPFCVRTVVSVDTAQKGTERSAYTAIEVFRVDPTNQHYMVYATRVQNKLVDVVTLLQRVARNWHANYILIEDAGQGSQILENFANQFICPVVEFSPYSRGSKEFMFDGATKWITSGRVLFPKNAPWMTEVMTEMIAFPHGKYRDYVDAFGQYCEHALSRKSGGTRKLVMGA